MKRRSLVLSIFIAINLIAFTSCKKDTAGQPTTPISSLASVRTKVITQINSTTIVSGGELSTVTTISDKGLIWGTDSTTLTIAALTKRSAGSGSANFTDTIKNLIGSTTYYIRAYAINTAGTAYGDIITFTTLPPEPNVYLCGYNGNTAAYWKNGQLFQLPGGTFAHSIFLQGNDIYISGEENGAAGLRAMYWKNGSPVYLTDGTYAAVANSIWVAGSDVYVAGYQRTANDPNYQASARYWKNGVPVSLTAGTPTNSGVLYAIRVVGNDVYAAGFTRNDFLGNGVATYWKNGIAYPLHDSTNSIVSALALFVDGDDVYVGGQVKPGIGLAGVPVAKYWKNGVGVSLTDGTRHACIYGLFVKNNDVYAVGSESSGFGGRSVALYWKNGSVNWLTDGTQNATATSVFVKDNDVFIAGGEDDFYLNAVYWKNGLVQPLQLTAPITRSKFVVVQ